MSSSSSGSGHSGGWTSWAILAVIIAYVVAIVWAYSAGLDPWVVAIAIPAAIGWPWFWIHMSHAIHNDLWGILCWILAIVGVIGFVTPLWEMNTALTVPQLWFFTTCGAVGIVWLAYELGHILGHHPSGMKVTIGMAFLAAILYLTRPPGAVLAPVPPITLRPPPTHSSGRPGFGSASSGGSASGSATASTSGGTLDCAKLSPRARQAAGCR